MNHGGARRRRASHTPPSEPPPKRAQLDESLVPSSPKQSEGHNHQHQHQHQHQQQSNHALQHHQHHHHEADDFDDVVNNTPLRKSGRAVAAQISQWVAEGGTAHALHKRFPLDLDEMCNAYDGFIVESVLSFPEIFNATVDDNEDSDHDGDSNDANNNGSRNSDAGHDIRQSAQDIVDSIREAIDDLRSFASNTPAPTGEQIIRKGDTITQSLVDHFALDDDLGGGSGGGDDNDNDNNNDNSGRGDQSSSGGEANGHDGAALNDSNHHHHNHTHDKGLILAEEFKQEISEVYKTCMRLHGFGLSTFYNLLADMLEGVAMGDVNTIVSPGCGQFFEAPVLDALFSPRIILGQDILQPSLAAGLTHNDDIPTVSFQRRDCSQPLCRAHIGKFADLAIFIHPNVLDTEVWSQFLDTFPDTPELQLPASVVRQRLKPDCMTNTWHRIIRNTAQSLRPNGLMLFICYERREQDLIELCLRELAQGAAAENTDEVSRNGNSSGDNGNTSDAESGAMPACPPIRVERCVRGVGNTAFLYVGVGEDEDSDAQLDRATVDWVVMRHYHCGVVARRL